MSYTRGALFRVTQEPGYIRILLYMLVAVVHCASVHVGSNRQSWSSWWSRKARHSCKLLPHVSTIDGTPTSYPLSQGAPGGPGKPGDAGARGERGKRGYDVEDGLAGADGADGKRGIQGAIGATVSLQQQTLNALLFLICPYSSSREMKEIEEGLGILELLEQGSVSTDMRSLAVSGRSRRPIPY